MTTDDKTHTFDWHEENKGYGSFLAWAVLTMMPHHKDKDEGLFDELSEATDGFKRCELGVTINGIPINAERFIKRLDESVDHAVEREAKKLLLARIPGLDGIYEVLGELEAEVKAMIVTSAEAAGFEITEDDWRER